MPEAKHLKVHIEVEFDLGIVNGPDNYATAVQQTVPLIEAVKGARIKEVRVEQP
jgi:hypothetical protein